MKHLNETANGAACSTCRLRARCLPAGLRRAERTRFGQIVSKGRKVRRGETLLSPGDPFASIYMVRSGCFKTFVMAPDGGNQVTGFQLPGEFIGLDGIVADRHSCHAVALEGSEVCALPFYRIEALARERVAWQHHVHRILSREIVRHHGVMLRLGRMRAEGRLASFLLDLAERLQAQEGRDTDLVLCMTREEIGSYLGMQLETVSRTFSRLVAEGHIDVKQKRVHIRDAQGLGRIAYPLRGSERSFLASDVAFL